LPIPDRRADFNYADVLFSMNILRIGNKIDPYLANHINIPPGIGQGMNKPFNAVSPRFAVATDQSPRVPLWLYDFHFFNILPFHS